jgi:hypothetical protein
MGYQLWIENRAQVEIRRLLGHVRQRVRSPYDYTDLSELLAELD